MLFDSQKVIKTDTVEIFKIYSLHFTMITKLLSKRNGNKNKVSPNWEGDLNYSILLKA